MQSSIISLAMQFSKKYLLLLFLTSFCADVINENHHPILKKWAIHLAHSPNDTPYTDAEATKFAITNGFLNLGKVGNLDGYFLFETVVFEPKHNLEKFDHIVLEKRWNNFDLNELKKRDVKSVEKDLTSKLKVKWFERQSNNLPTLSHIFQFRK